jgi:hypothetical protein
VSKCLSEEKKIPLWKTLSIVFLSPPRERIEVRGNILSTFFPPHPDPLPSREGEPER